MSIKDIIIQALKGTIMCDCRVVLILRRTFPALQGMGMVLREPVCKNQTYRGKGGKFDFFHILILDRLGYN